MTGNVVPAAVNFTYTQDLFGVELNVGVYDYNPSSLNDSHTFGIFGASLPAGNKAGMSNFVSGLASGFELSICRNGSMNSLTQNIAGYLTVNPPPLSGSYISIATISPTTLHYYGVPLTGFTFPTGTISTNTDIVTIVDSGTSVILFRDGALYSKFLDSLAKTTGIPRSVFSELAGSCIEWSKFIAYGLSGSFYTSTFEVNFGGDQSASVSMSVQDLFFLSSDGQYLCFNVVYDDSQSINILGVPFFVGRSITFTQTLLNMTDAVPDSSYCSFDSSMSSFAARPGSGSFSYANRQHLRIPSRHKPTYPL